MFATSRFRRRAVRAAGFSVFAVTPALAAGVTLLNVIYDVSREFYKDIRGSFEAIYPSRTILAENPVNVVVDKVVDRRGTSKRAEAYLPFLYTEAGQGTAARHNLRPRSEQAFARHAKASATVSTFTVDEVFGERSKARQDHFDGGGLHDQIIATAKAR